MKERKAVTGRIFAHFLFPQRGAPAAPREAQLWERALEICGDYSPRLLPSSEGRGLTLDLTEATRLLGPAKSLAQELRNRLRVELGLNVAVGLGPSPLVARLAASHARPGEIAQVSPRDAASFLARQPVSLLPGVARDWARWLGELGIRQLGDLAALPEDSVTRTFGARGRRAWELVHGQEPEEASRLDPRVESGELVSAQVDLRPATGERSKVRAALRLAAEEVARQLASRRDAAGQVRIELVFDDLRRIALRRTLPRPTHSRETLSQVARALYDHARLGRRLLRRVRVLAAHLRPSERGGQLPLPLAAPSGPELCPPNPTTSGGRAHVHETAPVLSRNCAAQPV